MGLELAEQLGWEVPDVIFYPTGGGHRPDRDVGRRSPNWKRSASSARSARGWSPCRPRAARRWARFLKQAPSTPRAGKMRIPSRPASACRRRSEISDPARVRESKGFAIAVDDEKISAALNEVAREEGLLLCPEGAATYAAYKQSLASGRVTKT